MNKMTYFNRKKFLYILERPCVGCGKTSIHLHHILPQAGFPDRINDESNLLPLCVDCHHKLHGSSLDTSNKKDIHPIGWLNTNDIKLRTSKKNEIYAAITFYPEHRLNMKTTYYAWKEEIIAVLRELKQVSTCEIKIQLSTRKSGGYRNITRIDVLEKRKGYVVVQ